MESTRRIEPVRVSNPLPLFAVANVSEGEPKSPRSLISVESDAMMPKEPASHLERIEIGTAEILVFPTPRRLFFNT
jgi:hypothetical protein